MHDPKHAEPAYSLHRVGEELLASVRCSFSLCTAHHLDLFKIKFSQLFGEDEDGGNDLDEAEKQGENGAPFRCLRDHYVSLTCQLCEQHRKSRRSAKRHRLLRWSERLFVILLYPRMAKRTEIHMRVVALMPHDLHLTRFIVPYQCLTSSLLNHSQVFSSDIKNLLSMADMWAHRDPPTPLDFDKIAEGSFILPGASAPKAQPAQPNGKHVNGGASHTPAADPPSSSSLKDQKELSLQESLVLFVSRYDSHAYGL